MFDRLTRFLFAANASNCHQLAELARPLAGAEARKDRGNAHLAQGELADAANCYREAIAIDPNYAEAYNNLGYVTLQFGNRDEAAQCFDRALELNPQLGHAHYNIARLHDVSGRLDSAISSYRRAVAINPDLEIAHYHLGIALMQRGLTTEAVASFRATISLNPTSIEAQYNLGNALLEAGRPHEALVPTEQAVRLAPKFAQAHYNLGNIFLAQGRLDEAFTSFRQAVALRPDYSDAHRNLGVVCHQQDRLDEAIGCYEAARSFTPDDPSLLRNLGLALLGRGRLVDGWTCYENRFLAGTQRRDFEPAEWEGEDLANKTLLIWGEQGIGDEILYANVFGDAITRAGRCIIECAPKLLRLFTASFPSAHVVPRSNPPHPATQQADVQCAAGMLAKWLRPTLESFPDHRGYLTPDAARVAYWRRRMAGLGDGLKVGFAWRSRNSEGVRARYYTSLEQWGPIFSVSGVHFINLQYDRCAEELAAARTRFGVALHDFEEVDLFDDLAEAAALNQALDLVVSAPTATSLMSAALGVPTWMMSYTTPWQTLGTHRVPWFPDMRCWPRRWDEPWEEILSNIAQRLQATARTRHTGKGF